MPHSNDTKIITCAGDHEIRIFDIERSTSPSGSHQYMSMNAARGKVFRSHSSSVKRIVTEASPFYFLTCSEDGEVRQWDIRQRADFYPRQRASFSRLGSATARRSEAPPPLISYADYGIELYTISCSPSQPHYIALGGTHVHCFLHDRRMMGRDRLQERGGRIPVSLGSDAAQQKLEDATRCVAKFAPYGQPKMNRNDTKHITACKLGQANPNELIVSWTGDHIYSFNILKSQTDARLNTFKRGPPSKTNLSNFTTSKKRKRIVTLESPSTGPNSRPRTSSSDEEVNSRQEVSILMQLGNGESIEVPLASNHMPLPLRSARERGDDDSDEESGAAYGQRVRTLKNCLGRTNFAHGEDDRKDEMEAIVRAATRAFEKIDDHIASRTFPITQSASIIDYEMKLRSDRAKVWRFAQASGTLARVLLGPMSDRNLDQELILHYFDIIRPAPREGNQTLDRHEQFGYDFCKVILLWLESGVGAVLREFSPESRYYTAGTRSRFPVSKDAEIDALETQFIPYLSNLATDMAVVYAGHGGAGDDPRERIEIFGSEKAAVQALAGAMKQPFSDLQGDDEEEPIESSEEAPPIVPIIVNRKAALRFWGHKVCMAVLSNAAIDVNFPFVATAFGNAHSSKRKSTRRRPRQVPTRPTESRVPEEQRLLDEESRNSSYVITESEQWTLLSQESYGDGERILNNHSDADDDDDDDDDDNDADNDDNDADEAEDDIQELERAVERALESDEDSDSSSDESYAAGSRRSKFSAGKNVPCSSHLRSYQGHCNVETTKDVNFYGLQDEYVVSGSDCGNFFIWEKKSGRLVNILEGDREVVNVIQRKYQQRLADYHKPSKRAPC
jgi:DDB1- and CUL4-associated factor 6